MSESEEPKKKDKPPAMSVVAIRLPYQLCQATDDFIEKSGVGGRSALVRLALASYIGNPELAKQSKEAA